MLIILNVKKYKRNSKDELKHDEIVALNEKTQISTSGDSNPKKFFNGLYNKEIVATQKHTHFLVFYTM